ncbi:MAG: TIGR02266 family protein [Deltaproteobacteria bacterium]|nr:TIGR02266 family protein [Deltaproteobacteria bacterium]
MTQNSNDGSSDSAPPQPRTSVPPDGIERRSYDRIPVAWPLDYQSGDNFLYSTITNISAMGIFVYSKNPLPRGTRIQVSFSPPDEEPLSLTGEVTWINPWREGGDNPNPGMGLQFIDLQPEQRERLVELVKTIAYIPETP